MRIHKFVLVAIALTFPGLLVCGCTVENKPPDTTIVNPPADKTIVQPPSNTTIVRPPAENKTEIHVDPTTGGAGGGGTTTTTTG